MASKDDSKIKALMIAFINLNSTLDVRKSDLRNTEQYEQNARTEYETRVTTTAKMRADVEEMERKIATTFHEIEALFLNGHVANPAEEPDYNSRNI